MDELQIFVDEKPADTVQYSSNRPLEPSKKIDIVCKLFAVALMICILCFTIISIVVLNHKIQQLEDEMSKRKNNHPKDNEDRYKVSTLTDEDIRNMSSIVYALQEKYDEKEVQDQNFGKVIEEVRNMSFSLQSLQIENGIGNVTESIIDELRNISLLFKVLKESQEKQQALGFSAQDFKFDKNTLHRKIYISSDGRTMSNNNITEEMKKGNGSFRNYLGVQGTRRFSQNDIIYYEVNVNYELLQNMSQTWLAFEFGFSILGTTDDHHYVGYQRKSWSIYCANNKNTKMMALSYQISKGTANVIKQLSPNIENTTFTGKFGFYVDGPKGEITFYHRHADDLEKLHSFSSVDFVQPLYPTFGVFSRNHVKVSLSLKTRQFIHTIPNLINDFI